MKFKLFVVLLVNIPLLSYLFESFLHGKDGQENLTFSFGILLIIIYIFQTIMIMSLVWKKIYIKHLYVLFIFLLALAFIGIINSNSVFYTCIVFLKYISLVLFSLWLSCESINKIRIFIIYGYFGSFLGFASFAVLHFYLSEGDFLFTLAQIQLPAFLLLFLFTNTICTFESRRKIFFYSAAILYILIICLGASRALDLEQFRFQYLPIALFMIINILLLPKNILAIVLVILLGNLIFNTVDIVEILLYR